MKRHSFSKPALMLACAIACLVGEPRAVVDPGETGADGGNSDGTGEAGSFGRWGGGPNTPTAKDSSGRASRSARPARPPKTTPALGTDSLSGNTKDRSANSKSPTPAPTMAGAVPEAAAAAPNAAVAPEAAAATAIDTARGPDGKGSGNDSAPTLDGRPPPADTAAREKRESNLIRDGLPIPNSNHKSEAWSRDSAGKKQAGPPTLILLSLSAAAGTRNDSGLLEKAEAALRLGFEASGRFRVYGAEEAVRKSKSAAHFPKDCFSEACLEQVARKLGSDLFIASQISASEGTTCIKLVLAETPKGTIRRAGRVWGRPGADSIIPFARETALLMAIPDRARADGIVPGASSLTDGAEFLTMPWSEIPWLNRKDSADNRPRWGWTGTGFLLAGVGLAWIQGQLAQEDGNSVSPLRPLLASSGSQSFMRGFFAAPTLGARYAAMGGAGIAHVDNGLALMMNPAGVAQADRENVVAAKRSLPDGTPSLSLAYAGPLYRQWSQGVGVQFEGDRLANETTLQGALAYDFGGLGRAWSGLKAGAELKLYLAQVGEAGTGLDRATGRSFGMGLDLGLQARMTEKLSAALAVRDAASFLRHTNTFTDRSYAEILPVEYRLGAAYCAASDVLLLIDGQKGIWADQADHLRLGGERILWRFLAIRAGLHEIFGHEAVRKLSVGFGLDTHALTDRTLKMDISLNYGY
ncbi:MAG: hypothetical protein ABIW76_11985, partial [Fibrobacteria bacterium]